MNEARDDRRARILDAAELLFAESGFDATPTSRIAERAEVPKGLLFYYFPRKVDLLLTLLQERLPAAREPGPDVVRRGDPALSLVRLHRSLGMENHDSLVMRTIIFRESATHAEVRAHLKALRRSLVRITERVLEAAVGVPLEPALGRQAAHTFVSVMLDHANARRVGGMLPDLEGAARVIALAVAPAAAAGPGR